MATREKRGQNAWVAAVPNTRNTVQVELAGGIIGIEQVNKRCGSVLTASCEGGNINIAKTLLDQGADMNCIRGRYRVPLQAAAI